MFTWFMLFFNTKKKLSATKPEKKMRNKQLLGVCISNTDTYKATTLGPANQ